MTTLYIDLETRSTIDLRGANVYRYVEDPLFGILMAAYAVDDEPVEVLTSEKDVRDLVYGFRDAELVAHNAPFERICIGQAGVHTQIEQWTDTQMWAAEAGYPQSLDRAAKALGLEQKDSAGTRLINLFCKPPFAKPSEKPEQWAEFVEYCRQDVVVLRELHRALPQPTAEELRLYHVDQAINDRGIRIDVPLARAAKNAAAANQARDTYEVRKITSIANANSNVQLLGWFNGALPNLQAATVEKALAGDALSPEQRRVLELRQELALVASKKYTAALDAVNADGRLRGQFRFFGAHTGRWSGRGVQLHNLPRAALDSDADVWLAIDDLMNGRGADAHTLKALVRPMFLGPMVVSDYSAIEARVLAWMAGEEWALQAFRDGRDLYVETAKRMGQGMGRREGKIAVLALGYNGAVGSLRAMGAKGTDEELLPIVRQWRKANQNITRYWRRLEDAFIDGGRVRQVKVERDGPDRHIVLPSGRSLRYHKVKSVDGRLSFAGPSGRTGTYGGSLTENVTQAIARDLLGHALVRMHEEGLQVLGHVHDEVLVAGTDLDLVTKLMTELPDWAHGLPLDAEGFVTARYRKG